MSSWKKKTWNSNRRLKSIVRASIHKVTLNEASLKIGQPSDKIECFKEKDSQIPKRNELLEEEQNKWRSLEKKNDYRKTWKRKIPSRNSWRWSEKAFQI